MVFLKKILCTIYIVLAVYDIPKIRKQVGLRSKLARREVLQLLATIDKLAKYQAAFSFQL